MEYPVKIIPNPRPLFYFRKRDLNSRDVVDEQVTNVLNKMYPDHAVRILDIACGNHALASRIKESRIKRKLEDDIVTVDIMDPIEPLQFTYWQIDLNNREQFEELVNEYRDYFDVILGIETIEHLENPKMYLHYLKEMLNDDGHIFISTPNINNPMTRRTFYKKGKLEQYSEQDLLQRGHISIILPHVLDRMASDLKLKPMIEYPLGLYPKFWLYLNRKSLFITICNLRMLRVRGSWKKLYIFKKELVD